MTLVAPLNVNDVSYATMINHEGHFSWQTHYLVMLGDVGVSLFVAFVAGALFGDIT